LKIEREKVSADSGDHDTLSHFLPGNETIASLVKKKSNSFCHVM
jgi:hypothetical protein